MVSNIVIRKRLSAKGGDRIKRNFATRRVKPAVVVDESQVVGCADLPINLWEKRKIIRTLLAALDCGQSLREHSKPAEGMRKSSDRPVGGVRKSSRGRDMVHWIRAA
jgi:hypothetical protein